MDDFILTMIRMTAYIAPFFLIPATFKFGMGVFGSLAGMINDRGRGFFDKQKKYRAEKNARGMHNFTTGQGKGALRGSALWKGAGMRAGAKTLGVGGRGKSRLATHGQVVAAGLLKDDAALNQLAVNSDEGIAIAALSGGTRAGAVAASNDLAAGWVRDRQAALGRALNQGELAEIENRRQTGLNDALSLGPGRDGGLNAARAQAAGVLMMNNKARAVAGGDWGTIQRGMERLHGGNQEALDKHSQTLRYYAMEGGRSDFATTGDMNTVTQRDNTGRITYQGLAADSLMKGFDRAGAGKVAGGHVSALQTHANGLLQTYHDAIQSGDQDLAFEAAHRMTALRNAEQAGYTPEDNKKIIYKMLQDANIDTSSQLDTADQFGQGIQAAFTGAPVGGTPPVAEPVRPVPPVGATSAQIKDMDTQYQAERSRWQADPAIQAWHASTSAAATRAEAIRSRAALYERGVNPHIANQQNPPPSDVRLKNNVVHIANTLSGIKLYRFTYVWDSSQTYVGVMAQDLLETHSYAVSKHSQDGYYRVDYAAIGLQMLTIEQWHENPTSIYEEEPQLK